MEETARLKNPSTMRMFLTYGPTRYAAAIQRLLAALGPYGILPGRWAFLHLQFPTCWLLHVTNNFAANVILSDKMRGVPPKHTHPPPWPGRWIQGRLDSIL